MNIDGKYKDQLSTQKYGGNQSIEGVEIARLDNHVDDGGNFLEILRLNDQQVEGLDQPFAVKQLSFSMMMPGVIKAYHVHQQQEDLWFVPPQHRLLVNLHDLREGSATFDVHQRLVLGGGKAELLRIPTGVAHGAKNSFNKPVFLFYATNNQFNADNPDEGRLAWDIFGADAWDLTKG